jgi:hypothetical protein
MFVVEHRHGAPAVFVDLDNLLEELVARIQRLALFVARVLAVFADQDDAVDGELAAAERQRFGNGWIQLHRRIFGEPRLADIVAADLIDEDRHQIHGGTMMRAIPAVALEKAIDDVLGVGVFEVGGADRRQLGTCGPSLRAKHEWCERRRAHAKQERSPGDVHG